MLMLDVEKRLGDFIIAAQFESASGVTALFGPSGSGKTSLVNMIAGLIAPDRGRIMYQGKLLFDAGGKVNLPPHRRRFGYVFQDGRLFPQDPICNTFSPFTYGRNPGLGPAGLVWIRCEFGHQVILRPSELKLVNEIIAALEVLTPFPDQQRIQ